MLEGDLSAQSLRLTHETQCNNWKVIEPLRQIGLAKGTTSAQVALAFLLSRTAWIVSIFETTKVAYIDENITTLDMTDIQRLGREFSQITVEGESCGPSQIAIDDGARKGTDPVGDTSPSPLYQARANLT